MKKRILFYLLLASIFVFFLESCAKFFPVNSAPSERDQCINIKRNKIFESPNYGDIEQWRLQSNRSQWQQEYQAKGCDRIMKESQAKDSADKK